MDSSKPHQDLDHCISAAQFSARRLPEIKSLWRSYLRHQDDTEHPNVNNSDESFYFSGGGKISNRHLRRRAGSHRARKHHRFPAGKNDDDLHNNITIKPKAVPSRKSKRKTSILRHAHSSWQHENQGLTAIDHRNWLVTHLWHTKRFHMSPPLYQTLGGFCVPLCHNNRDAKAVMRLLRENNKSTIQDATWTMGGVAIALESLIRCKQQDGEGLHSSYTSCIRMLHRICGHEQPSFLEDQDFLSGSKMGYSIIYATDAYPLRALCPAMFLMVSTSDEKNFQGERKSCHDRCNIRIFVPPNLVQVIQSMLDTIISTTHLEDEEASHYQSRIVKGQCFFRIRGNSASSIIQSTLQSNLIFNNNQKYPDFSFDPESHYKLCHGTAIHASLQKSIPTSDVVFRNTRDNIDGKPISTVTDDAIDGQHNLIFISQCPNRMGLENDRCSNFGCSGWDILCNPDIALYLFHILTVQGAACAVGLMEHAALLMEADPPLPLWPRDYPDTPTGQEFWTGQSNEWTLVNNVLETAMRGKHIINGFENQVALKSTNNQTVQSTPDTTNELAKSLPWDHFLVAETKEISGGCDYWMLMRGQLGEPINNALRSYDSVKVESNETKLERKLRRPRRPVRHSNYPLMCPPLSKDRSESFRQSCMSLLKTYSLPSLIRCHVQMQDKGTLSQKSLICMVRDQGALKGEQPVFGFIVTGMFSPSRGKFHGVGLLSTQALINYLSKGGTGILAMRRGPSGCINYYIRAITVSTDSAADVRNIFISLLF